MVKDLKNSAELNPLARIQSSSNRGGYGARNYNSRGYGGRGFQKRGNGSKGRGANVKGNRVSKFKEE